MDDTLCSILRNFKTAFFRWHLLTLTFDHLTYKSLSLLHDINILTWSVWRWCGCLLVNLMYFLGIWYVDLVHGLLTLTYNILILKWPCKFHCVPNLDFLCHFILELEAPMAHTNEQTWVDLVILTNCETSQYMVLKGHRQRISTVGYKTIFRKINTE